MGVWISKEPKPVDDRSIPRAIEELAAQVANEVSSNQLEMDTAQVAAMKTQTLTKANNTLDEWALLMHSNALEALEKLKKVRYQKSNRVLASRI